MTQLTDGRWTGAVSSIEDPSAFVPSAAHFLDRRDAGDKLAPLLERFRSERPVVVGIPRGGVPVAAEVARVLAAPLDVVVVRKIGAPQNPEFAVGALAQGGVRMLNERAIRMLGLSEGDLRAVVIRARRELDERLERYRREREPIDLKGRTAILVDDGLATGSSASAAVESLRKQGANRVILAVPVAAPESAEALRRRADEVVCVETPADLWAVGMWYEDFRPTTDEEVATLLASYNKPSPAASSQDRSTRAIEVEVAIPTPQGPELSGDLIVPDPALGIVAFAHGSGSSRLSSRNRAVAHALNDAGLATLLFDLLSPSEEIDRSNVFDIPLLAARLVAASAWLAGREELAQLPLGYFGASTGAAAALSAAAELGSGVHAVVSRGGRPDLAHDLGTVQAPTLLIVGGADTQVLQLNREAQRQLRCPNQLAVVPDATHLFEEPGALDQVSQLASDWFTQHLQT